MRFFQFMIIMTVLVLTMVSAYAATDKPYQPAGTITLFTESLGFPERQPDQAGVTWRVETGPCDVGGPCIVFYHPAVPDPVCRVVLSGPDSGLVLSDGSRFAGAIQADGFMFFPGFSIPCDVLSLPIDPAGDPSRVVAGQRKAGTTIFIERLEVNYLSVSPEEAMAQGWIREPAQLADAFILIRATNQRNGELAVQQLWNLAESWWLYEETPYRRSWRLR